MKVYFDLLRVHQWLKNLFIFAAPFFGGSLLSDNVLFSLGAGFLCFCAVSSAIYILNDICDVESDRRHPEKQKRPIPSGVVSISTGLALMTVLFVAALAGAYFIDLRFFAVVLTYGLVNAGYSLGLKRIALLDIVMVSSGFILRVLAGGIISGVEISHWLFIMTFLLALFLAIAKRRDDLLLLETTGAEMRKSIKGYTMEYVNIVMGMMGAVITVAYILYVTSPEIVQRFHGKPVYVSSLFVIVGLLRYLQVTLVEKRSGSPTQVLLRDLFIQVTIFLWVAYFAVLIYLKNGIQ